MHKIKTELPGNDSLKILSSLLNCFQHAFQVGITENHKLNNANVDFELPLELQQSGRT